VITGFNTDIEYGGVTYHVQTEDKGLSRPIILSLVYDRGTILASKRSSYEDLLGGDFNEKVLSERLHKQHRLICAAIQAGRIEDLKKMTAREAAKARKPAVAAKSPLVGHDDFNRVGATLSAPLAMPSDAAEIPIPKPIFDPDFGESEKFAETAMVEGVSILEDEIVLPAEAVMIIEESEPSQRPESSKLALEIMGDVNFRGGERSTVDFMVSRGSSRIGVSGAQIMVKILGSSFRPVIFHASTDDNGVATVNLQLPNFTSGRAAFLARALSDGEEIELRRSIAHS
jgi:hypothetical protein